MGCGKEREACEWESGYRFSGGVHGVDKEITVAPDWGALLHFKYLDDFRSKVTEAITRKQHTDNAGHYVDYDVIPTFLSACAGSLSRVPIRNAGN